MIDPNMIGAYGPWASTLAGEGPGRLSFRGPRYQPASLDAWRGSARKRFQECLLEPASSGIPKAEVQHQFIYDGLHVEHLSWQLPYGPATEAFFLKPAGAEGRLPAVLGLHDHGGDKYFGTRKIVHVSDQIHPMMKRHRQEYYGSRSWANELARQGFAVLVHDGFAFGSRRVRYGDLPELIRPGLKEVAPEAEAEIEAYNGFAGEHENLMAKSLFCAGTTWPGVAASEDQRALDYLCSRPDVDPARVGCGGLSGGGLRTVYLAGLDDRIRCACCVGMMTTWRDFLLHKCFMHTWMIYIPGLPLDLDYPEILGLQPARPTLVLNNTDDEFFTLDEMRRAERMLTDVFTKAGSADRFKCSYYQGPHKFDRSMQADAFAWFNRWLKP